MTALECELLKVLEETVRLVSCDNCSGRQDNGRDGMCKKCWSDTAEARELISRTKNKEPK